MRRILAYPNRAAGDSSPSGRRIVWAPVLSVALGTSLTGSARAQPAPSPAAHGAGSTAPTIAPGVSEGEPPAAEARDVADSWLVPSLHGLGLLTAMRIGEAFVWPEPFADLNLAHMGDSYADAFTHWPRWDSSQPAFEWDGDDWTINVVGHGVLGSELYLRARTCRRTWWQAALLTAAGTVAWEYGFEASAVRPSALDLWYTPVAGVVFGEARFLAWSAAASIPDPLWRSMLTSLFDPFGEVERMLGSPC